MSQQNDSISIHDSASITDEPAAGSHRPISGEGLSCGDLYLNMRPPRRDVDNDFSPEREQNLRLRLEDQYIPRVVMVRPKLVIHQT
jgi:hypothetical protein